MGEMRYVGRWGNKLKIDLWVATFKEGKNHIAYAPALDLAGYGKTLPEARKSFEIIIEEYLIYTNKKGTLLKELRRLGWKVSESKKGAKSPALSELIVNSEILKDVVDKPHTSPLAFETYEQQVALPVG